MKGEPILIECEGGGAAPNAWREVLGREGPVLVGYCSMCGQGAVLTEDFRMPGHVRDDVLARIERGDFG